MTEKTIVLTGGQLIDGKGEKPLQNFAIRIEGSTIIAVGTRNQVMIPPDCQVIDVGDRTVMPGLIDAHVHLFGYTSMNQQTWVVEEPYVRVIRAAMDAGRLLDAGFTTIRDAGGLLAIYIKQAIEEGSIKGPRIIASGLVISQTAGHGDWHFIPVEWNDRILLSRLADGVSEVRKAAREQLREGADMLKIFTTGGVMSEKDKPTSCQYSMEEIRAFVEEAHNAGVRTGSHAQATRGIKNAILAGVDNIDHGIFMDDEAIEFMLEQETTLVPTLAIVDAIVTNGRQAGVIESSVKKAESVQVTHIESFKKAFAAGVICGLGTDYLSDPFSPMGKNAVELEIYVKKAGLSPMDAIVCATRNNAIVLGLEEEIGTLEVGKQADLLVVDGDPLENISVLREKAKINMVFKGGRLVAGQPKAAL
ncbi:MAG: amidohydrolase family protein [Anaerolineales bacterium]|nr:amidohydrolase family protein [Anaerolineales bacterium]